jgi:hypothetical protein
MTSFDDLINDSSQKLDELKELIDSLLGGNMATQEEIKNAIIQALEESASRFLSGQGGNLIGGIEIDADGNIVVKPAAGVPDDPTTTADNEARAGGVIGIRKGFNLIWTDLNAYYTANPQVSVATAQLRIKSKYKLADPAAMDAAVLLYYNNRGANPSIPQVSSFASSLDARLYCKGETKETINAWIFDTVAAPAQDQAIALVEAVGDAQIEKWYRAGSFVSSTDYVTYSCVPVADDTLTFVNPTNLAGMVTGVVIQKPNHRLLLEVSGKIDDPANAGAYADFFYHVAANGTKTFADGTNAWLQTNGVISNPTAPQVPFRADGVYKLTMDTVSSVSTALGLRRRTFANAVGQFVMLIKDLGEVIS